MGNWGYNPTDKGPINPFVTIVGAHFVVLDLATTRKNAWKQSLQGCLGDVPWMKF